MGERWDGNGTSLTRGAGYSASYGASYGASVPRRPLDATQPASLADVLERVLDKGIVIAGDITISLAQVELLQIKVRLLIASIDKAQEMGINWWQADPALTARARHLEDENRQLRERVERLESRMMPPPFPPQPSPSQSTAQGMTQGMTQGMPQSAPPPPHPRRADPDQSH